MNTFFIILVILAVIVVFNLMKSGVRKTAINSLNWENPVLLGDDIQSSTEFRQIVLDDMNAKIAKGAEVIKEGKEIPGYLSVDGRNSIYHNASPHYQVGQVYSTSSRSGLNSYFIVYIWINEGITYDAPYEVRYQ
jgi:hypothetical protein